MKKRTQPGEISRPANMAEGHAEPKYNAINGEPDRLWLRKKRQFGGLICPPMGYVPEAFAKTGKRDPDTR